MFCLMAVIGSAAISAPHELSAQNDEILIVTGGKSPRPLKDTPTSVAVVTGGALRDEGVNSAYEILDQTPNVAVDGNRTTFSIRGVDAYSASGAGDGALATIYVDGAAVPRLALAAGPLDLYDIDQVEIFRGPQSTVQGRNALAGTVILKSTDPGFEWVGGAQLSWRNKDQQRRAGGVLGGPIVGDQLAFRLAAEVSSADGLIRNITTDGKADHQRSLMLRGKLLMAPRAAPDLTVVGTYFHDRHERGTFYTELDTPFDARQRLSTADFADKKQVSTSIATLRATYALATGATVETVTSYSRIRFRSASDADRSASPGRVSRIDDQTRSFQQEVRLSLRKSWIDGVIGGYYLRDRNAYSYSGTQNLTLASLGVPLQLQAMGLPPRSINAVLDLYGGVVPLQSISAQPRTTENHAAFADFTISLNDKVRLNLGLRYDAEAQLQSATQMVSIDGPLPAPDTAIAALAPIVGSLNSILQGLAEEASGAEPVSRVRYRAWLPKFGLTYHAMHNAALSLTIQRGYRAGGSGFNEQRAYRYGYAPEYVTNYEGALRSTFFGGRLALNANVYRTDWKQQQVLVQLTPGALFDTQVVNAGRSLLQGFEVEARQSVGQRIRLVAGIGHSNARFLAFNVNQGTLFQNAPGKDFPQAPRWTLSGNATYVHPGGLFANMSASYRSAYFQDIFDEGARDIEALGLLNAKIGWRGKRLSAYVTARNLFNAQKLVQFFVDSDGRRRGLLNAPRTIGLSLEGQL